LSPGKDILLHNRQSAAGSVCTKPRGSGSSPHRDQRRCGGKARSIACGKEPEKVSATARSRDVTRDRCGRRCLEQGERGRRQIRQRATHSHCPLPHHHRPSTMLGSLRRQGPGPRCRRQDRIGLSRTCTSFLSPTAWHHKCDAKTFRSSKITRIQHRPGTITPTRHRRAGSSSDWNSGPSLLPVQRRKRCPQCRPDQAGSGCPFPESLWPRIARCSAWVPDPWHHRTRTSLPSEVDEHPPEVV